MNLHQILSLASDEYVKATVVEEGSSQMHIFTSRKREFLVKEDNSVEEVPHDQPSRA